MALPLPMTGLRVVSARSALRAEKSLASLRKVPQSTSCRNSLRRKATVAGCVSLQTMF